MNNQDNEKVFQKSQINWFPGHMAKTKREIKEKINLVDIVYEVIDSRMPISSRMRDMDDILSNKPRIIIMTKYDLCDKEETNKFISYYESLGYKVLAVDLINNVNVSKIVDLSKELMSETFEKMKQKGLKPRNIRALIIGVPNVGKSTLINRLVGKKSVNVGNRPGVTKNISWIRIHKDIDLLDTPGILWPKFETNEEALILASLSSIKEEIIDSEELSIFILKHMSKLYPNNLKERYGINEFVNDETIVEVLDEIARKRGAMIRGGESDYDKVYNIVIRDLKEGYLGKITFDRLKK